MVRHTTWKNWGLYIILTVVLCRVNYVTCSSYYMVSASGTIFSGRSYGVVVALFNSQLSGSCEVRLTGPNLRESMQMNLTPFEPVSSFQFKLPELKEGIYELHVESIRGPFFKKTTRLHWKNFKSFVKVQTPKVQYTPKELLQFRVLFFNEILNPVYPVAGAQVWITDGKGNQIKTFKKLVTVQGVYEGSLKLGDNPVMGAWRICAQNGVKTSVECAHIQLSEYVTPAYQITLKAPKNVASTDESFEVQVIANYDFSDPLEGNTTLYIETYLDENEPHTPVEFVHTNSLKKGRARFSVDVSKFADKYPQDLQLQIQLTAVVEERFTGEQQTASQTVTLFAHPYVIKCVQNKGFCRKLEMNKVRSIGFRIKTVNGHNVQDKNGLVKLIYTPLNVTDPIEQTFRARLNYEAIVNFKVKLKSSTDTSPVFFKTEIEYKGIRQRLLNTALRTEKAEDADIRPKKVNRRTRDNLQSIDIGNSWFKSQYISFELDLKLTSAAYVIMVNGNVVLGRQVIPDLFGRIEIKVNFGWDMWPFAHILLYGMEANSNVLYMTSKSFAIKRNQQRIKITAPQTVSPGETVTLRIKSIPKSYVGLMAINEKQTLAGDGGSNDLNSAQMEMYSHMLRAYGPDEQYREELPSHGLGLLTLTNVKRLTRIQRSGNLKRRTLTSKSKRSRSFESLKKSSYPSTYLARSAPQIRNNFNDVWLFQSIHSTSARWINYTTIVPDSITTWQLNAFSIHRTSGLTVLDKIISIRSSKLLFMRTKLPFSIKKGEILRLPIVCFNKRDKRQYVNIRLSYDKSSLELLDKNNHKIQPSKNADKKLSIPADDSSVAFYYIKARKLGNLQLNFSASTSTETDIMHRQLKVVKAKENPKNNNIIKPNHLKNSTQIKGVLEWIGEQFENVRNTGKNLIKTQLETEKDPKEFQPKTEECLVTDDKIAEILKKLPTFEAFDNGEELISKLMSSLYLWDYLQTSHKLKNNLNESFQQYLNDGFQSLLRFRRSDGGFSYYAQLKNTTCSSTWISAYALKAMHLLQLAQFDLSQKLFNETKQFLVDRRRNNTNFIELCETPTRNWLSQLELTLEVNHVLQTSTSTDSNLPVKSLPPWLPPTQNSSHNWQILRQELAAASHFLLQLNKVHQQQVQPFNFLITQMYGRDGVAYSYESSLAEEAISQYLKQHSLKQLNLNQSLYFQAHGLGQLLTQCGYLLEDKEDSGKCCWHEKPRYILQIEQKSITNPQYLELQISVERNELERDQYVGSKLELVMPSGYELMINSVELLLRDDLVRQAITVHQNTKLLVELAPLPPNRIHRLHIQAKRMHQLKNLQPGTLLAYDVNAKQEADLLSYKVLPETSGV